MTDRLRLVRIVSGGQTGVDRAALDAAMAFGLACGGWVPRGRRAEDGAVPPRYPMRETRGYTYAERTRRNVRDSDGTLILTRGRPTGGTALTGRLGAAIGQASSARRYGVSRRSFRDRRLARPARHSRTQRRRPEGKHLSRHPRPGTGLSVGSVECARECV